jgi:hypothetical protein
MSEYLLEAADGGSIANVAYNPCGVSSTSQLLYKEFLNNLFKHGENCLGRAVFAAKCSIIARNPEDDSIYGPAVLWTLLGDPALRIRHRITSGIEEGLKPRALSYVFTISPNPCDASTTIRHPSPLPTPYSLSVFDASGRLVLSRPVRTSSFVLRTSSFSSGVYVARCMSSVGCASVRLLVRHRY